MPTIKLAPRTTLRALLLVSTLLLATPDAVWAQPANPAVVEVTTDNGTLHVELIDATTLHVTVEPRGKTGGQRTLVLDPKLTIAPYAGATVSHEGDTDVIRSDKLTVYVSRKYPNSIRVVDAAGHEIARQKDAINEAKYHDVVFEHPAGENLYGMRGLDWHDNGQTLLRNHGAIVAAGGQGDSGAPFFFTTHFGVLIDSAGGVFNTRDGMVLFNGNSRDDVEYFLMVGKPTETMARFSSLSGRPPLPPKWSLGFIHSIWGTNEANIKEIAAGYRAKHIPLDAFILDFDWKAWGEDNYGEWRWNSTKGAGNRNPATFPGGASGQFAKDMLGMGVKMAGILKPRVILYKDGSTTELQEAAHYAEEHNLWLSSLPPVIDYVTERPARDLDFAKPETRAWYWQHLAPSFHAGMVGWWNDEADNTNENFQFFNMQRAIYDGQRADSDVRVWSINRNFYAGAQRYGYGEWSGDIQTGFVTMRGQRARMLSALNTGEPHWTMDAGGFVGHPSDENYARWMQFAAFVPIDRVHGVSGEKRYPWAYGATAEAAATNAIRLRYSLLPYIYSFEHRANQTGIGIVQPLFWQFPDDPKVADTSDAWMFGDALLVSPVVYEGERTHPVYLPAGTWYDYFRGTRITGGKVLQYKVDAKTWSDIPVFVRAGSIIASQPPQDFVGQAPAREVALDVFPSGQTAAFTYYDDDGATYSYEKDTFYRQVITAERTAARTTIDVAAPSGQYRPALKTYMVRVHGVAAKTVTSGGIKLAKGPLEDVGHWTAGRDKYGPYTAIRLRADQARKLVLQ
jgi:alpha-glucosidase